MVQDPNDYYPDSEGINEWVDEYGNPLTPEQLGQLEALGTLEEPMIEEEPMELPPEMMVRDPIELIPIAIANNQMLQITYQNRKGEIKLYVVEPYEIGGNQSHPAGYLWAFDTNASSIKSFFLGNLLDIQLLNQTFVARQA